MSPEMAWGDRDRLGPASDIYLLGAILFQIITGKPPHDGQTINEVLAAAAHNKIHPFDDNNELLDIALNALATRPEHRPKASKKLQRRIRQWYKHGESIALSKRAGNIVHRAKSDIQQASQASFLLSRLCNYGQEMKKPKTVKYKTHRVLVRAMIANGALNEAEELLDRELPEHSELIAELQEALDQKAASDLVHQRLEDFEQQTLTNWNPILQSDIAHPASWSGWKILASNHHQQTSGLDFSGGQPGIALHSISTSGDFRLAFRARLKGAKLSDLSCFFSAYPSENIKEMIESGYQIKLGAYSNTMNMLIRAGRRLDVKSATPLHANRWSEVLVERIGSTIRVELDGKQVLYSNDAEPLQGTGRNAFGLFTWESRLTISKVHLDNQSRAKLERLTKVAKRQLQLGHFTTARHLYEEALSGKLMRTSAKMQSKVYLMLKNASNFNQL